MALAFWEHSSFSPVFRKVAEFISRRSSLPQVVCQELIDQSYRRDVGWTGICLAGGPHHSSCGCWLTPLGLEICCNVDKHVALKVDM